MNQNVFDQLKVIKKEIKILPHLNSERKIIFRGRDGKSPSLTLPRQWIHNFDLRTATSYLSEIEGIPCITILLNNSVKSNKFIVEELEGRKEGFLGNIEKNNY